MDTLNTTAELVNRQPLTPGMHIEPRGVTPAGVTVSRGQYVSDGDTPEVMPFLRLEYNGVELDLPDTTDGGMPHATLTFCNSWQDVPPAVLAALRVVLADAGIDHWNAEREARV